MWVSCDIYIYIYTYIFIFIYMIDSVTHLASGFTLPIFKQPRYVKACGHVFPIFQSKKYFRCVAYLCSTLPSVYFMVLWSFVIFWWAFYILFSVVNIVGSPHDKSKAFKMQFNVIEWNVKAFDERDCYLFASLFITLAIPILRKALIFKIVTRWTSLI